MHKSSSYRRMKIIHNVCFVYMYYIGGGWGTLLISNGRWWSFFVQKKYTHIRFESIISWLQESCQEKTKWNSNAIESAYVTWWNSLFVHLIHCMSWKKKKKQYTLSLNFETISIDCVMSLSKCFFSVTFYSISITTDFPVKISLFAAIKGFFVFILLWISNKFM